MQCDPLLHINKRIFNGVVVRGARWEVDDFTAKGFDKFADLGSTMDGGVVHDDYGFFGWEWIAEWEEGVAEEYIERLCVEAAFYDVMA